MPAQAAIHDFTDPLTSFPDKRESSYLSGHLHLTELLAFAADLLKAAKTAGACSPPDHKTPSCPRRRASTTLPTLSRHPSEAFPTSLRNLGTFRLSARESGNPLIF
jgi:hypothetical protein